MSGTSEIRFDRFAIDLRRRALLANDKLVPLHARAFDILVFLITQRARAVARDEILREVFHGLTVSPSNVAVQVHSIRKAIAGAGGDSQVIKTLPGQCYQFIADVIPLTQLAQDEAVADPDPTPPPSATAIRNSWQPHRVWTAALCALLMLGGVALHIWSAPAAKSPRLSIVVLPFRNLGADRSQDYFADAISDDLATDLGHIPASTVIARESAASFKDKPVTMQQIGRDLLVRYALEGSLRMEDTQYHVNADLIDTASGAELWSGSFDFPLGKVADIRDRIVRQLASILNFQLDQLESSRSLHDRPNDPDALDLFFRARSRLDYDHTAAGFAFAQTLLEGAVAQKPDFADAQAELGWMLLRKVTTLSDPNEAADFKEAKQAVAKALTLSPQNPLALAARGRLHQIQGDCTAARPDLEQALVLQPASLPAHTMLAICAQAQARFDEAAAQYETILRLNPVSASNKPRYGALGLIRLIQGKYDEALDLLNRARTDDAAEEGDMGPSEEASMMLVAAQQLRGDHAAAKDSALAYLRAFPGRSTWRISTYLPKGWLALESVRRVLRALQDAGVPEFAAEDAAGLAEGSTCANGDFAVTPRSLPNGTTVSTQDVVRLLAVSPRPLVIDVGSGAAPIEGAFIYDSTRGVSPNEFAATVAREHAQAGASILVLGDGPTGCASYRAAEYLIAQGMKQVVWYRGGEENWYRLQTKQKIVTARTDR